MSGSEVEEQVGLRLTLLFTAYQKAQEPSIVQRKTPRVRLEE